MKNLFKLSLVAIILLFAGCSKKEDVKLNAFSPEAFAYSMDNGWDLNATIRLKGFVQKEADKKFSHSVEFSIDIAAPDGTIKKSVFKGSDNGDNAEKVSDIPLEAQASLNSSDYKAGKYKVIFNIKDNLSGATTTAEKELEITKD